MSDKGPKDDDRRPTAAIAGSVSSVVFSVLASSHHWLHMGVLLVLGSSANMTATMTGMVWLRRAMIAMTILASAYSVFRLLKHRRMPAWMNGLTIASILVSFAVLAYTVARFGW
ncbi:hypothetical protein GE107_04725 [Cohnella sp. CFH 77786]|uniref:hypothetical protein n=1 Tax=Cohnella sp. CFH 77786 TaxID=2662265 RepID=UPI001C60A301|nr:hypothetical protein [Cohnella sp. CFH 77786]MBW5445365.1 hypothetical protein [Cohnella sp. CFH 77786]